MATGTSIVIQLENDRIIVAADTRSIKQNLSTRATYDDECKIIPLGNAAFSVAGAAEYSANGPDDPVASWDARSDAIKAYSACRFCLMRF
jgi:hypothetical protein